MLQGNNNCYYDINTPLFSLRQPTHFQPGWLNVCHLDEMLDARCLCAARTQHSTNDIKYSTHTQHNSPRFRMCAMCGQMCARCDVSFCRRALRFSCETCETARQDINVEVVRLLAFACRLVCCTFYAHVDYTSSKRRFVCTREHIIQNQRTMRAIRSEQLVSCTQTCARSHFV